jgi:branched-chain amino acid transport system permease protein
MLTTVLNLAVSVLFLASMYVLIGVGLSLLYGVSQTINLAQGGFMIVGAYLTFLFISGLGLAPLWSLIIVPIIMGILGIVIYKVAGFSSLLNRNISRADREFVTLIMTFALSWIAANAIAAIFTANPQTFPGPDIQYMFSNIIPFRKLLTIVLSMVSVGVIWLIIRKTWIGLGIRCVFDDNEASRIMGINSEKVHFAIFFIAFFTAGLGGTLYSYNYPITPYQGTELTMIAFVVTIIGGVGSVKGVLFGALIVALVEVLVTFFAAPLLKIAFVYFLFIIILLIRPSGLVKNM